MNLTEVNGKLLEIANTLERLIPQLSKAELAYDLRFYDLLLHSGLGTIAAKEAEAKLTCQQEGLLEPVQNMKGDVRLLYHQKDCYIEISRNLRAIAHERDEIMMQGR